jgi:2-isopropylmalate synthase
VHITVNGTGERMGNASLEQTVTSLELVCGVKTGIKLEKLRNLSELLEQVTGREVRNCY